ncbi:MAG TPA: aminotransferase class IV [Cytophagaceae bacterium]|jgi:4-amino-4-deoxychorismate lyase|nr:aminotransferase class IV [Cytophagaceae bacterium]
MNYLIYNDQFIAENNFVISPYNRAFCYGDGLFETMLFRDGKLLFLDDHLKRLTEGLVQLDIKLPKSLTKETILKNVVELKDKNNLHQNARIKIQVWRKQGGLITPETTEAEYTILASPYNKAVETKEKVFTSEGLSLNYTPLSKYKTLNVLPYLLAGIEKKKRSADEILLTDTKGNIAEACSSNVFWSKSDTLYTPSLETGCIEGIMRKQIIRFCHSENIKVVEGLYPIQDLFSAELIFTSNITGLSLLENINNKKINTEYTLYQAIRIGLDLL